MTLVTKKPNDVKDILEYLLNAKEEKFSLSMLEKYNFTRSELRTLLKTLYNFNFIYSINRDGIYINSSFINTLKLRRLEVIESKTSYLFKNEVCNATILKEGNEELLDLLGEIQRFNFNENIVNLYLCFTQIVFKHNLQYKKEFRVEDDLLVVKREGVISKNDSVVFTLLYKAKDVKVFS